MRENRPIRLVRKSKPPAANESSTQPTAPIPSEPSEREIKTVVSRWVREHRQRSEEFRITLAAMFKDGVQEPSR